jgi:SAM-dependent methyltransferase
MHSDYSEIAGYYDRFRTPSPPAQRFWLAQIVRWAAIRPGSAVLDLGCGTGRFAIPLTQALGAQVFALDREAAMIRQAIKKDGSGGVHWTVGDAHALPYAPLSFDAVFMAMVIHHVDDRPRALASVLRVLRPGGRLAIWTTSPRQIRGFLLGPFFPSLVPIDLERFPAVEAVMLQLRAAGFTQVQRRAVVKRETVAAADLLERVRNRYISTLSLIPQDEFAAGIESLAKYLAGLPGGRVTRTYRYTFISGAKPD